MTSELDQLARDARHALAAAQQLTDLESFRHRFLGRQGSLTVFLRSIAKRPATERPAIGAAANALRDELTAALEARRQQLAAGQTPSEDLTILGIRPSRGHLHPLTRLMDRMTEIWQGMGFSFFAGPELEEDWYNFTGLNMPKHHPARDTQDTFYVKAWPNLVLRTHTSTVQLRATERGKPPFRVIELGRVFRHEATDASHESTFFQCDGFAVDRAVRVTDLIGTLKAFLEALFGRRLTLRVRPHYYPFVEPGMDLDVQCIFCSGKGCGICKRSGWLEMLGSGMIHPLVIRNMQLDPKRWKGFAFGMGVDRLAMLYFRYADIRLSHSGDLRFLKQFS